MDWVLILTGALVVVSALCGVVLTLVTLPGTWVMLAVSLLTKLWAPELHAGWWALGIGFGLCLVAEVAEFIASAAGSARAGGSKAGAGGSLIGSLVGLGAGTIFLGFLPVIGSILGAVVGAGVGALVAERGIAKRTWGDSARSGGGAAVGRALSVVLKGSVAAVLAFVLIVSALVPGF